MHLVQPTVLTFFCAVLLFDGEAHFSTIRLHLTNIRLDLHYTIHNTTQLLPLQNQCPSKRNYLEE